MTPPGILPAPLAAVREFFPQFDGGEWVEATGIPIKYLEHDQARNDQPPAGKQ